MKPSSNFKSDTDLKNEVDPFAVFGLSEDIDNFFIPSNQSKANSELDQFIKDSEARDKLSGKDMADLEKASSQPKGPEAGYAQRIAYYLSMEYLKELFNIHTEEVIDRLKYSVFPLRSRNLFQGKQFDLYGPLWIILTTVFTTSIFGTAFISDITGGKGKATSVSINQIGKSLSLTLFYIFLNSFVLYYLFKKSKQEALNTVTTKHNETKIPYMQIVSILGYSFAIIPIIEVLLVLPVGLAKLAFLIFGLFISCYLIWKEVKEINKTYLPKKEVGYIWKYAVLSHSVWLLLFKLLFL